MSILQRVRQLLAPVKVNSYWDALPASNDSIPFLTVSRATALQAEGNVTLATGRELFRDEVLLQDAHYVI